MKVGELRTVLLMLGQIFAVPGVFSAHSINLNNDRGFLVLDLCCHNATTGEVRWKKVTFTSDDDEVNAERMIEIKQMFEGV